MIQGIIYVFDVTHEGTLTEVRCMLREVLHGLSFYDRLLTLHMPFFQYTLLCCSSRHIPKRCMLQIQMQRLF